MQPFQRHFNPESTYYIIEHKIVSFLHYSKKNQLICIPENKTTKNITMNNSIKKYLGALLVILGAILLIISFFCGWNNFNGVQFGALGLMIAGLLLHIFIAKKD